MSLTAPPINAQKVRGVDVSREQLRTLVSLSGEHDIATAQSVSDALVRASTLDRTNFVVDLSAVEFFDASIVEVFANFHRFLELQSREIALCGGSPFAQRILGLCGLAPLHTNNSEVDAVGLAAPGLGGQRPVAGGA